MEDVKLVREHINERLGFTEDGDPIKDMGIGKVPFHYNNLFIAKRDIEYIADRKRKKIIVPKGTLIMAQGGGYYGTYKGDISLGNIDKVNGKHINNYQIRTDKDNYYEIYYDVWEKIINLTKEIEDWYRESSGIIAAAKSGDMSKVFDEIEYQEDVIKKIKELLK